MMVSGNEHTGFFHCDVILNEVPVIAGLNRDAERLIGQKQSTCVGKEIFQIHFFNYMLKTFLHELHLPVAREKCILEMPVQFRYNKCEVTSFILCQKSRLSFMLEIGFTSNGGQQDTGQCFSRASLNPLFVHDIGGLVVFNRNGVLLANRGAGKILCQPLDKIHQWSHAQLKAVLTDDQVESVSMRINDILMLDKPNTSFECSILSGRNEENWLECFGCRIRYERKPACLVSFHDISLQKRFARVHPHLVSDNTAVITERQRIARILHDSAAQNLSLALMRLAMLRPKTQETEEYELVMESYRLVMSCARQLRDLSHQLDDNDPDNDNLIKTLKHTLIQLNRGNGPKFSLIDRCADGLRLPPNLRIAISNVLGELFANICRHSESRNAIVILETTGGALKIIVKDDGRGFQCESGADFGFGLKHVRNRILSLNGDFSIRSQKNKGTRVEILLPL